MRHDHGVQRSVRGLIIPGAPADGFEAGRGIKRDGGGIGLGDFKKDPCRAAYACGCLEIPQNPATNSAVLVCGLDGDGQKLCVVTDETPKRKGVRVVANKDSAVVR